jgi:hypothetical protein
MRIARPVERVFARRIDSDETRPSRGRARKFWRALESGRANAALLESRYVSSLAETIKEVTMKNPLESIWGTIICGLILTAILYWAAQALLH